MGGLASPPSPPRIVFLGVLDCNGSLGPGKQENNDVIFDDVVLMIDDVIPPLSHWLSIYGVSSPGLVA